MSERERERETERRGAGGWGWGSKQDPEFRTGIATPARLTYMK